MGKDTKEYARIANEIFDALRYYDVPLGTTKNKKKWGTGDFFNAIDRLADIRRTWVKGTKWEE